MANTKKIKKIKKQIRLLDNKETLIRLEKLILDFTNKLDTEDKIFKKSEEIVNMLEKEEDLVNKMDLELQLEALKYVLENLDIQEYGDEQKNYPEIGDPNFSSKIAKKREFNQYRIKNDGWNTNNLDDISKKCSWNDLTQTQKLLQNFISPHTPYKGLLVFHGVGVGKTCTSITIAEGFKEYLDEKKKKVYVLLKPSIRENFRRSIINLNKTNMGDDEQCTGDNYFDEMGKSFVGAKLKKSEDLKKLEKKANKIINKYYDFYGYGEFVSIYKQIENSIKDKDSKDRKYILQKKLKEKFSDSVIIIDEAHNITPRDKSYSETGVPNINKKKKIIKKKLAGGSYNDLSVSLSLTKGEKDGKEVTSILSKIIKMVDDLKLVLLSATPMYNEAPEVVYLLNLLLANDKKPLMNPEVMFDNGKINDNGKDILRKKANGYVSYLRGENPINFPYKLEPEGSDVLKPEDLPSMDMKNNRISEENRLKYLTLVNCPMNGLQLEVYKKYFDSDTFDVNAFDTVGSQICNIVFNTDKDKKVDEIEDVTNFYSEKGMKTVLKLKGKKYNFTEGMDDYFSLDNLENVGSKIGKIVKNVNKSNGLNFIYSQFKNSGVYAIAFALEMEGYVNYNGETLLNLPRNHSKKFINGKQARYLIITGDSSADFNKYKKEKEHKNFDGSELKVILGTQAAGEGLNIFNVRGIHILDPWHHLNRLEQIVGRGLRNCSHKNLALSDRNLTVFLYVVTYPRNHKETLDIKMYRKSEKKTVNVAEVQRELKSLAIDCHLNKEGNVYSGKNWEKPISVRDLMGKNKFINIGDKPYSRVCDYMKNCDYKCYGEEIGDEMNNSTYKLEFSKHDIRTVIKILKKYFKETKSNLFRLESIIEYIQEKNSNLTEIVIYKALYEMIEKEIEVIDYFKRKGRIIYRGKNYIFQPFEMSNTIPLIERKLPYRTKKRKLTLNNKIIKDKEKQKETEEAIGVKRINDLFMEFIVKINKHTNKFDHDIINEIIVEEVYDRVDYKDKLAILEYILDKLNVLLEEGKIEYSFDESTGLSLFRNGVQEIASNIVMSESNTEIFKELLNIILSKKIFIIGSLLCFKISLKDDINYHKINDKRKIVKVSQQELIDIKLNYVSILKRIKNKKPDGKKRKTFNIYCFIKEHRGNIILKILEKKLGIDDSDNSNNSDEEGETKNTKKIKNTKKTKGSSCKHFDLDALNELLSTIKGEQMKEKGKGLICDKISYYMREKDLNDKEFIYFYGLDEYLELNKN